MNRAFLTLTFILTASVSNAVSLSGINSKFKKTYSAVSKQKVKMRKALFLLKGDTNKRFNEFLSLHGSISSHLTQVDNVKMIHTQADRMSKGFSINKQQIVRSS